MTDDRDDPTIDGNKVAATIEALKSRFETTPAANLLLRLFEENNRNFRAFAAQSRKLHAVMDIPGVKGSLAELEWDNGDEAAIHTEWLSGVVKEKYHTLWVAESEEKLGFLKALWPPVGSGLFSATGPKSLIEAVEFIRQERLAEKEILQNAREKYEEFKTLFEDYKEHATDAHNRLHDDQYIMPAVGKEPTAAEAVLISLIAKLGLSYKNRTPFEAGEILSREIDNNDILRTANNKLREDIRKAEWNKSSLPDLEAVERDFHKRHRDYTRRLGDDVTNTTAAEEVLWDILSKLNFTNIADMTIDKARSAILEAMETVEIELDGEDARAVQASIDNAKRAIDAALPPSLEERIRNQGATISSLQTENAELREANDLLELETADQRKKIADFEGWRAEAKGVMDAFEAEGVEFQTTIENQKKEIADLKTDYNKKVSDIVYAMEREEQLNDQVRYQKYDIDHLTTLLGQEKKAHIETTDQLTYAKEALTRARSENRVLTSDLNDLQNHAVAVRDEYSRYRYDNPIVPLGWVAIPGYPTEDMYEAIKDSDLLVSLEDFRLNFTKLLEATPKFAPHGEFHETLNEKRKKLGLGELSADGRVIGEEEVPLPPEPIRVGDRVRCIKGWVSAFSHRENVDYGTPGKEYTVIRVEGPYYLQLDKRIEEGGSGWVNADRFVKI